MRLAAKAITAAAGRGDRERDRALGNTRDDRDTPVFFRAHEQASAEWQHREGYFNFGSFHKFCRLAYSLSVNWTR